MRNAMIFAAIAMMGGYASAQDRPFAVGCERGRWDGYFIELDPGSGILKASKDKLGQTGILYEFTEDPTVAFITTDKGRSRIAITSDRYAHRTVSYKYGNDYITDTIYNDGYVIQQYTRSLVDLPVAYTFQKKCSVLR